MKAAKSEAQASFEAQTWRLADAVDARWWHCKFVIANAGKICRKCFKEHGRTEETDG